MNSDIKASTHAFYQCHLCPKVCNSDKQLADHLYGAHDHFQENSAATTVAKSSHETRAFAAANCPECCAALHGEREADEHFARFHPELSSALKNGWFGESVTSTSLTLEMLAEFRMKQPAHCIREFPVSAPSDARRSGAENPNNQPPSAWGDQQSRTQQRDRVDRLFSRFRSKRSKLKTQLANTAPFFVNENGIFEFNSNEDPLDINCPFCITHKTTIKGLAKHCVNHHVREYAEWKSGKYGQIQLRFVPPDADTAVAVLGALKDARLLGEIPHVFSCGSPSPERQRRTFPQVSFRADGQISSGGVVPSVSLPCPFCRKSIRAKGIISHCLSYHRKEYNAWRQGKYGQVPLCSLNFLLSNGPKLRGRKKLKNLRFVHLKGAAAVTSGSKKMASPCPFCGERIFSKGMGKHCIYFHPKEYQEWKSGKYGSIPLRFVPIQIDTEAAENRNQCNEPSKISSITDASTSVLEPSASTSKDAVMPASSTTIVPESQSIVKEFFHSGQATNQAELSSAQSASLNSSSILSVCHFCNKTFDAIFKLTAHFLNEHVDCSELRNAFLMQVALNEKLQFSEPLVSKFRVGNYVCDICYTPFMTWHSLGQHYRNHRLSLPWPDALTHQDTTFDRGAAARGSRFGAVAYPRHQGFYLNKATMIAQSAAIDRPVRQSQKREFIFRAQGKIRLDNEPNSFPNRTPVIRDSLQSQVVSSRFNWNTSSTSITYSTASQPTNQGLNAFFDHGIARLHDATSEWFPCLFCAMRFQDESAARVHMSSCRRYFSTEIQERKTRVLPQENQFESLKEANQQHKVVYRCKHCKGTFESQSHISSHMKHCKALPLGLSPNSCLICSQHFDSNESLLAHISDFHSFHGQCGASRFAYMTEYEQPVKSFPCGTCGKVFSSTANLLKHKVVHTSARVNCQHCGREFKMPCHLARHYCLAPDAPQKHPVFTTDDELAAAVLLDDDETMHECSFCNATFREPEDLRTHSIRCRQHGREAVGDRISLVRTSLGVRALAARQFRCNQCPMQFDTRASLFSHQRVHKQQACPQLTSIYPSDLARQGQW